MDIDALLVHDAAMDESGKPFGWSEPEFRVEEISAARIERMKKHPAFKESHAAPVHWASAYIVTADGEPFRHKMISPGWPSWGGKKVKAYGRGITREDALDRLEAAKTETMLMANYRWQNGY